MAVSSDGRLAACLGERGPELLLVFPGEGSRLRAVDEKGRQRSLKAEAVLVRFADGAGLGDVGVKVATLRAAIEARVAEIDPAFLWESLPPGDREFSLEELASFYFSSQEGEAAAAMLFALAADPLRFRQRGKGFSPRSAAQVEEEEKRRESAARREGLQKRLAALVDAAHGERPLEDVQLAVAEQEELFSQLAAFLFERKQNDVSRTLAEQEGQSPRETAYEVLAAYGRIPEGVDPLLLIAGITREFSADSLQAVAGLAPFAGETGRTDLSALAAFSIDDEDTREVDDALTVSRIADGSLEVGVHIADVASFIAPDSALDREAVARTITVYLPTGSVTMLPERLSCDLASLNTGSLRPALSLLARFAPDGTALGHRFVRSVIRVARRFDYDGADVLLAAPGPDSAPDTDPAAALHALLPIADALASARYARGALGFARPELRIRVRDGEPELSVSDTQSPAHRIVSEMMIFYNSLAAAFAIERKIPVIFRTQSAPDDLQRGLFPYEPWKMGQIFRRLTPAKLSLEPGPHAALGSECYVQASSPIRRFADLLIQRQLAAHLAGAELPYQGSGALYRVLAAAEETEKEISALEKKSRRFWMLTWLERQPAGTLFEAVLLEKKAGGTLVELVPFPIQGLLVGNIELPPGERLTVRLERIAPERGTLYLKRG